MEEKIMRKKSSDAIIAEALAFFESMRSQAPAGNELVIEILDEQERKLHEELLKAVLQRSKKAEEN
jgi:hypothetical protein